MQLSNEETFTRANGEKWAVVLPESGLDRAMMRVVASALIDGVSAVRDGAYYVGYSKDGFEDSGVLRVGMLSVYKDDPELSDPTIQGFLVLLSDGQRVIARLTFDAASADRLPFDGAYEVVLGIQPSDRENRCGCCLEGCSR